MWEYEPPLRDMQFVMDELLQVHRDWAVMPRFTELDANMAPQILEEAGKFVVHTLAPINAGGDFQGCRFQDGSVITPDGFRKAYASFCEGGWPTLTGDVQFGGQGLPQLLNSALYEMLYAANHAWTMYAGLANGAYACLREHASEQIKSMYLPKIVSGECLSTMCLTEPQAGSDVGLVLTRAERRSDGSYAITGSKIFISGGEHDFTANVIHLVLARLPDAPVGSRGISLFLVPKLLDGATQPQRNRLRCDGIEEKMGIKGSATCLMSFDAAQGFLIGEPNRGLAAMFVMMNAARLNVGISGLGHAEMAYQNALRYACERKQMRAAVRPAGMHASGSGADPIVLQPAMRKTLMTLRAFVQGERALAYWAAHLLDIAEFHPDREQRAHAHDLVSLLTPVIKSFFTDNGFTLSSAALQVWGGYGYIHDYGIEQTVRDSRIAMIYEGTNEIQSADLLVRKVIGDGGRNFGLLMRWIIEEATFSVATPGCERFGETLRSIQQELDRVTAEIITESADEPELGHRVTNEFLRLVGLMLLGAWWARAARVAAGRLSDAFYASKLETANFYFDYLMPEAWLRLALLQRRRCPLPWLHAATGDEYLTPIGGNDTSKILV